MNVVFWVGVKSNDSLLLKKHGNFDYFKYSKYTWEYWCRKNNVLYYEYDNPSLQNTGTHKVTWQRWFDLEQQLTNLEWDKVAVVDASYMIFSEQLMLKQMLVKENIPHKTLVSNVYDNSKFMFSDVVNMYGIWNREEISLYYRHYGFEKRKFKGEKLKSEIEYLYRCINSSKKLDIKLLKSKIHESTSRQLD